MLGKLFNDQNLRDESGDEGEGKLYRPRFDIDLDSGVVRMPTLPSKSDATDESKDDSAG